MNTEHLMELPLWVAELLKLAEHNKTTRLILTKKKLAKLHYNTTVPCRCMIQRMGFIMCDMRLYLPPEWQIRTIESGRHGMYAFVHVSTSTSDPVGDVLA